MHLPFLKKTSVVRSEREYLFSLEISSDSIKSSIWAVINDKIQVLAIGPICNWDGAGDESLIAACDESLSEVTQKIDLSGNIQPEKVILGLPSDWVLSDKIVVPKLKLLKNLTKELSLKAVGFVVTPQALVRHMHLTEGVMPTAILVGIQKDYLEIILCRLGKITFIENVRRSGKIGPDVSEGLSRFQNENMLPSRILLYSSKLDMEDIKQELLNFSWQSPQYKLPFLHFPKIEILPPDFSIKAISNAGGEEVAKSIGLIPTSDETDTPSKSTSDDTSPDELGFFSDTDVALTAQSSITAQSQTIIPQEPTPKSKRSYKLPNFPTVKLPNLHLKAVFLIIPLFIFIGIALWFFWFQIRATISIVPATKALEHKLEITADSTLSATDFSAGLLSGKIVSTKATGEKSKPTTGSKIVGDKAVGEVTIVNGTSSPRTFPAGTVLASPSGLKFVLDTSIEIASASGTADPNSYQPGKATVKVSAASIGIDSNLSAGTQFKIGSFSSLDYVAKNETAFSGGSSRQVQTVSKQDIAELRSDLVSSLSEQAKTEFLSQTDDNEIIIPETITSKSISEQPNHQPDDVSDSVSLQLTVEATGMSIMRHDLDQIVSEQITLVTPEGYSQFKQPDYKFNIGTTDGKKTTIAIDVSTELLPEINEKELIHSIIGKPQSEAMRYIKSNASISDATITLVPEFLSWIKILPHVESNIRLSINPNQ